MAGVPQNNSCLLYTSKKVLVFGSGPIRIGQGIEFDYCSVHCVWTLKEHGCEAVLVNNNPETVSTAVSYTHLYGQAVRSGGSPRPCVRGPGHRFFLSAGGVCAPGADCR